MAGMVGQVQAGWSFSLSGGYGLPYGVIMKSNIKEATQHLWEALLRPPHQVADAAVPSHAILPRLGDVVGSLHQPD